MQIKQQDNPCWGNKQSGEGIGAESVRTTLTTTLTSWDKISKNENFVKVEKEDLQAKEGPDGEVNLITSG